jgi:hypothetical protein
MTAGQTRTAWARIALQVLRTPYPHAAGHVALAADDTDVKPERLHPAFHGSLDWHSSVHMQWSLVRLLSLPGLPPELVADVVSELDRRLTDQAVGAEVDYLRRHPSYERPYGWAWALVLAAAVEDCPAPAAAAWRCALEPLVERLATCVLGWLPRQAYPVRHGVHSNTAFALTLLHEACTRLGRGDVVAAVEARARGWFGADRGYDPRWEPSGADFLSPALSEASLMLRVLPPADSAAWLEGFLPGLTHCPEVVAGHLLEVPTVLDSTDGQFVHLVGLALSRAWQLRELAAAFPDSAGAAALRQAADRLVASALPEITGGDFMATHWLVSLALLAEGLSGWTPPAR